MTSKFEWPIPAWLEDAPVEEREGLTKKFYLALAAVYGSPAMNAKGLSKALGYNDTSISVLQYRQVVPIETALKLEAHLGRRCFPREMFNASLALPQE